MKCLTRGYGVPVYHCAQTACAYVGLIIYYRSLEYICDEFGTRAGLFVFHYSTFGWQPDRRKRQRVSKTKHDFGLAQWRGSFLIIKTPMAS